MRLVKIEIVSITWPRKSLPRGDYMSRASYPSTVTASSFLASAHPPAVGCISTNGNPPKDATGALPREGGPEKARMWTLSSCMIFPVVSNVTMCACGVEEPTGTLGALPRHAGHLAGV